MMECRMTMLALTKTVTKLSGQYQVFEKAVSPLLSMSSQWAGDHEQGQKKYTNSVNLILLRLATT